MSKAALTIEIKEGDVFDFRYKEEFLAAAELKSYPGRLRHCFDGQLVATKQGGRIVLIDTYWSDNSSRCFTVEEALVQGELTFRFNLNDVEKATSDVSKYFDEGDWFDFSRQHGYCEQFVLKKGAKRSKGKMLEAINERMAEAKRKLDAAVREIESLSANRQKIELGDLTVYF